MAKYGTFKYGEAKYGATEAPLPQAVPLITFADVEEALASPLKPIRLYVRIGGEVVPAYEAHPRHGVNQPIGTVSLTIAAPRPEALRINAELEVIAGYPGAVATRFSGRIPADESAIDDRGAFVRVQGVGWASLLDYPEYSGLTIDGPVALKEAFRSLCLLRGVPSSLADETVYPDGSPVMLGGNDQIDGGDMVLDDRTSPLRWLDRAARLFGYRIFGTPGGVLRLARVSGMPNPAMETSAEPVAIGGYVRVRAPLNLRDAPGLASLVLGVLPGGTRCRVVGGGAVVDGYTWWQVDPVGFRRGWVAELPLAEGAEPFVSPVTLAEPVWHYEEAVNVYGLSGSRDRDPMVTYWEVLGARYTDVDGGQTEIRSIAEAVPYAEELDPPGYRKATGGDPSIIVTEVQAAGCRNVLEIDTGTLERVARWDAAGHPEAMPGDVVNLHSPVNGIVHEDRWLMSIDESISDSGYRARMTGWAGGGVALPAGNDCVTEAIPGGPWHVGDEHVSWYVVPSPAGAEVRIPIMVSNTDYSSLRIRGRCHGTNSWGDGLGDRATTGSKIELWQRPNPALPESGTNEIRRVGSAELPTDDEQYSRRRPYSQDRWWLAFQLPIGGTAKVGAAELRLVAGKNPGGVDDFEIKGLTMTYCGVGEPTLPGIGGGPS
jgi:hypothetical protein